MVLPSDHRRSLTFFLIKRTNDMSKKHILIVDDEAALRQVLEDRLLDEGFIVTKAVNGKEGLSLALEKRPDLILLDIMMPELNGYQVCKKIKEDDSLKNIPVVMLTAKAQESDKFWGLETGADDYITKPFEFKSLLKTITKHLKHE